MGESRKILLREIVSLFFLCFFAGDLGYPAIAATDAIDVTQPVLKDGSGISTEGAVSGGIVLPIDATPPEIIDFRVYDVVTDSARISFRTDEICLAELYYGKSKDYGAGPLTDHPESYEETHEFFLDHLDPGAKYYLRLVIKNQKGIPNVVTHYGFYTLPEFKEIPAVGSLSASQMEKTVVLEWKNPDVKDFQGVQVNRQTNSPALTPDQGEKLFFGLAEGFVDAKVADDMQYYYTVFAFGVDGRFSSGAVVSLRTDFAEEDGGTTPPGGGTTPPIGREELVKDVRNLQAVADLKEKKISLRWVFAEMGDFAVEIRRDLNFPPMSPLEGERVYEGKGTSFDDFAVRKGQVYFYTVYVRSAEGRYSSGAVIAAELKEAAPEPSAWEEWKDMTFVDVGSGVQLSTRDGKMLDVLQGSTIGASYGVEKLPTDLTSVALQLGNTSYLLDYDKEGVAFRTSFVVPEDPGEYAFDVVFLNGENEVFFEKNLRLRVLPRGEVYAFSSEKLFGGEISLRKLICRLGNLFGKEDTSCMRRLPVEGAVVKLFRYNEDGIWETWNAREFYATNPFLTDEEGKYGVYLADGKYEIDVSREGFDIEKIVAEVDNNILAEDIRIHMKKDKKYGIIILAILLLLVAKQLKKRISYRRKNKEEK